ncbi:MAG: gliding motility-associated C-terminal domain-containing protein [Bacteroidota bacterium]|nr:gliding motility-associated C-terminal domain-containing protein [Bacteroidota bacterium]
MRKIFTLLSLLLIGHLALAQDAALAAPSGAFTAPVSGCALTAAENVTVRIFNFGPGTINTNFNVSYTINGGPPVTETVVGPNIPQNTSFFYTFTTPANLSVPGTYTFNATVSGVAGDGNPGNDTYTGYVVNAISPSVGGTIAAPSSVCISGNSGTLTLSGHTGSVLGWEYSTDGGGTWISISNTSTTQTYNNLTVSTRYRAQVQNGACTPVNSAVAIINIDPVTVGGTVTTSATVCSGSNIGTLTSAGGRVGAILKWQFSIDGGVTFTDIANTTSTQSYLNLTQTTRYRVEVQSGACLTAFSTQAIITVSPNTVGGTVSGGTTVCSGTNSGNLTLSGHTGGVTRWEFSTNAGATWTNITNTTATQSYLNLTATRYYRALVKSGACASVYSGIDSIVVVPASIGGSITSAATVCSGANSGTLTLAGNAGTVQYWEFSTNGGVTYTNIANTTNTQSYLNLTQTTIYRANVMNGACPAVNSGTVTITVNPPSIGGVTSPNDTVCSGSNSGSIMLSGHTGTVTNWLSSPDGITWTNIANTTTTQTYTNLIATTYYAAVVTSGVCPSDTSASDTIMVDVPSIGGTIAADTNVCYGNNSGTLTLSGNTGSVVRWEFSIDGGINWNPITNTTNTHTYANITLTTIYRAVVQNGSCANTVSSTATLTVDPVSVGGTISGSATACGGSNSGTLNLIGYVGSIQSWESSTDGGLTWTTIANTTAVENYLNIITTTVYRAIVRSGVCSNDTSATATITVDPPSDGGLLAMSDTVCASSNFGTLTLSGFTGTIQHWESSIDGGLTWLTLANTTASQVYMNLAQTTTYRVNVKSGVCNAATSNAVTITVDPVAVGGSLSGSTVVCDTVNSGTLTLAGSVGTIQNWESSTDGGLTWILIANTTTTNNYTNLTDTTWFRVIVMSGLCGNDTSTTAVIEVNPPTVGGMVTANDTVCSGMNNGTLYLNGHTGTILGWEISTDGGFNWSPLSNTSDSLVYNNLTITTSYRVNVKSGICNADISSSATITVNPVSVAGTLSGATPGCENNNTGTLTLSGYTGNIQNWESSTDGGATWSLIVNTNPTYSYVNLSDTTWFRVIVQSGVCAADTSAAINVIVYPKPVAMFTADTVCMNNSTSFTNSSTINSGFIQFHQWDFGDGSNSLSINPTHIYSSAGTFVATLVTTSNFGCLDTATMNILVNPLPPASIGASGPLQFCMGDSVILTAASGGYDYMWSTGDSTQSITVMTSGTYVLTITDSITGCSDMDSVYVIVNPAAYVFAGNDTTLSLGSSMQLNATGVGIVSWGWFPNTGLNNASIPDPIASPVITTTYELVGTDANGCMDKDSITITVILDFNVTVSNLMTPNDDGFNDRWIVENIENYPNTKVVVLNREGQEVFSSDAYDSNWDGTNKFGQKLPDGTYYYIIMFEGSDKIYKGAITILRQK